MSCVKPRRQELVASRLQGEALTSLLAFCETLDANPATLLRWVVEGRPTARGRVFLDAIVTAEGWRTSAEAVERFRAGFTGKTAPSPLPPRSCGDSV